MHTACVWSEKLPFAGYSVVKDPACAASGSFGEASRMRRPANLVLVAGLAEASHHAKPPGKAKAGGEYRARTGDLLVANQALSQLS